MTYSTLIRLNTTRCPALRISYNIIMKTASLLADGHIPLKLKVPWGRFK